MKKDNTGTYHLFKMTKTTPCFKKGQKVWMPLYRKYGAYGRHKISGKWICSFIRPEIANLGEAPLFFEWNHGKPNVKFIDTIEMSGYLHDLFTVMHHNKRMMDSQKRDQEVFGYNRNKINLLTLKYIGYKASAKELIDSRSYLCASINDKCHQEKLDALRKQKEAMIKEIKERFDIDLTDPCDSMSISEMRKLPWMRK